jgi:uncharacterized membrane protein
MQLARSTMAVLYIAAGSLHFVVTETYMRLMPTCLPAHRELVLLSGAAEIAGGLGLLVRQTREGQPGRAAAWGLVALLVAVFPANLTLITDPGRFPQVPLWAAWLRLPLQLPLLYWAWCYTHREAWQS